MIKPLNQEKILVGWREWASLPELGIEKIKVKVDTGARTSALHAFRLEVFSAGSKNRVRFAMHPLQDSDSKVITCVADLIDKRMVIDSGGHREERSVIRTLVQLGTYCWPIEITLTNRDDMRFRMLLGRTALRPQFMVDPGTSFLHGR